jgi:peroxiredoxin
MKKTIVLLISVVFLFSAFAQKSLTITGKVEGFFEGKIYLNKLASPSPVTIDSVDVNKGDFTFVKGITNSDAYMINFGKSRSNVIIFPENENIQLTVKLTNGFIDNVEVRSGAIQKAYEEYSKSLKDERMEMNKLYTAYQTAKKDKNETETARLENELNKASDASDATEAKKQQENASNLFGIYLIFKKVYAYDYDKLKNSLAIVSPVAQKSEIFKSLTTRLAKMERVKVGSIAPDFTLPTPEGKMLSLSQFRGKVVVVDCWASWCGPCRAESPNMVALYNANKDKDFTIIGVSLDKPNDKDKWIKAIADDKLAWNHVSDLKYWHSMICDLYIISAIPETILIDKDGKIVARGLRGDELKAKVAELLK